MSRFSDFGNDLYTGKRSIDFVGRRRTWYVISAIALLIALSGLVVRGLNLGIEFTGGSEFRVSQVSVPADYESRAEAAVQSAEPGQQAKVSRLGSDTIRVQTERLGDAQSNDVREALARSFTTTTDKVSASFVGPSWGESVSRQALRALVVFLVLTMIVMALYFRTWTMAMAALVALIHDMVFTVAAYAWTGLEVSPATMIGFLTVLGYSLYDTVVVFDKVRENTTEAFANRRSTYAAAANLGVNQTVVRSINTTVVALLPIAAVLAVVFTRLGPGTLLDLALALFIGMAVGAYSSIFIATPLLVSLRSREEAVRDLDKHAARVQAKAAARTPAPAAASAGSAPSGRATPRVVASGTPPLDAAISEAPAPQDDASSPAVDGTLTGRTVHKYAQTGPRNQPRRQPKSKR
ncbi:MAG TPA: protein translocase subunit SecF [Tetrasphaera sp.]|jgi:preprotein translocase subunit SecF|nr:protein translocase subunit SecF [Tetrasphaera sp.]